MSRCSRCGNTVSFRVLAGEVVPIHDSGRCAGPVEKTHGKFFSPDACCRLSACPICGRDAYFVRSNGGAVWFDPPLGPPWPKHGCFDTTGIRESEVDDFGRQSDHIFYGVVDWLDASDSGFKPPLEAWTDISIVNEDEKKEIRIKNNGKFLLGRLCAFDSSLGVVWAIEYPEFLFKTVEKPCYLEIKSSSIACREECAELVESPLVPCKLCGTRLSRRNVERHMEKMHGGQKHDFNSSLTSCEICGVRINIRNIERHKKKVHSN